MGKESNPSPETREAEKRSRFFRDMRNTTGDSYQTPVPVILLRYRQHPSINLTREECLLVITLHSYSDAIDDHPFVGNAALRDELGYSDCSQIRKLARSLKAKGLVFRQSEDRMGRAEWILMPLWAKLGKLHGDKLTARQTRDEIATSRKQAAEDRKLIKAARAIKPAEDVPSREISGFSGHKSPAPGDKSPAERAIKPATPGFKDPLLSSTDVAPFT